MRLHIAHNVNSNLDLSSAHQFKIKASAHAFKLLVDQYRHPIRATVREIITNAVDIHIRTGQLQKIEVLAPSMINNFTFTVRDFGTGLAEDEIAAYYATFFASDKNNTDAETGGLGLGCKCPLTYTDQFTVESRQNGTQTTYLIFIAADGIPHILKQAVIDYVGHDGLTVHIPCAPDDVPEFTKEIAHAISYAGEHYFQHNTAITITREAWFEEEIPYEEDKTVVFRFLDAPKGSAAIIMGGVFYEVEMPSFDWDLRRYLEEFNTEIIAPVGAFEIHPSRESLIFRSKTVKSLKEIYLKALSTLRSSLGSLLSSQPSLADAIRFVRKQHDGLDYLSRYFSGTRVHFDWNGVVFDEFAVPSELEIKSIRIQHWRRAGTVKLELIHARNEDDTYTDILKILPKNDMCVFLNGRVSLKKFAIAHKLPEEGGLVFKGDYETARYFVEDILGLSLTVLNRSKNKQVVSGPRAVQTTGNAYEYDITSTTALSGSRSLEELIQLRDLGFAFVRVSDKAQVEALSASFDTWMTKHLITMHRGLIFIYVPASHRRICTELTLRSLNSVFADENLVTVHHSRIAMYRELRHLSIENLATGHELAWVNGLSQCIELLDEEDGWYLARFEGLRDLRSEASVVLLPVIDNNIPRSWEPYVNEVITKAAEVTKKYVDLITVLRDIPYSYINVKLLVTQWYKGATS